MSARIAWARRHSSLGPVLGVAELQPGGAPLSGGWSASVLMLASESSLRSELPLVLQLVLESQSSGLPLAKP